jgi:sulfur carrier protein
VSSPAHPAAQRARIRVNGKERDVPFGATVAHLLDDLAVAGPYALVERNGEPVERDRYEETVLEDGDVVVVARPVAGG